MKLLRLKLNDQFRSLQPGFEIYFFRDYDSKKMWDFMPYCLVGKNGCGKSNVLEVLAAIFYHIECVYLSNKPEGFDGEGEFNSEYTNGFFSESCTPDAFELEYKIPVNWRLKEYIEEEDKGANEEFTAHIQVIKNKYEAPIIKCLNKALFDTSSDIQELTRIEVKDVLPEFIVGYSSGENEILSLPFFKMRFINYDEYEDALRYETGYSQPEGRLIYIDNQHSQAVFLTNYLMQDEEFLKPIYDTIGIKAITQFRIIINQNKKISKFHFDENDEDKVLDEQHGELFELTSLLKRKDKNSRDFKAIDKLQSCSTSQFFDSESNILYLDYLIDEDKKDDKGKILTDDEGNLKGLSEMKKAFRSHFDDNPFELFRAFQILLTLNLFEVSRETKIELYMSNSLYVNETVPVLSSEKRIMRFKDFTIKKIDAANNILSKSLSDGEHQYLHAMGICLLFKNTNSLFLMDEPETHFNPDWRAKFVSTLKECLVQKEDKNMRELLLTSHSPFVISDSLEENVLVFKKSEDHKVFVERPGFNTFGASVNQITIDVFGRVDTIGDLANSEVERYEKRYREGEDPSTLIKQINSRLGDSVEKTILINRIRGFIKD